jgi:heterodisulfide reductase subunit C
VGRVAPNLRVALYNTDLFLQGQPMAVHYSMATKVLSTETAFRVASEGIQIFGGYGMSKEYHIEKLFRDARAALVEDGTNETLALDGAERLGKGRLVLDVKLGTTPVIQTAEGPTGPTFEEFKPMLRPTGVHVGVMMADPDKCTSCGLETALISPVEATILSIPGVGWSILISVTGLSLFTYIMMRRLRPLLGAAADPRLDRIPERFFKLFKYAILQYRQPRYRFAGILHIFIFSGFIILSLRSITLILSGIFKGFTLPGLEGGIGRFYASLKDLSATVVLIVCIMAMIRRGLFNPRRYVVPARYGKGHTGEALFVLGLISGLILCDMIFEASLTSASIQKGLQAGFIIPGTGVWLITQIFKKTSISLLQGIHLTSYYLHDLLFFFFLCFLPLGKHFHVITSLPNIFLMKLDQGTVKPVQWKLDESKIVTLESVGVKKMEDFSWKHILDFYSCADCGRCSDQCPANAVGRPLSPRFLTIKCRDYIFERNPLVRGETGSGRSLVSQVLEEDEIWFCTTCGACEAECPLMIEYIDKIVDLRRGLVDNGLVPPSLQKPLQFIEKRGNPYGIMEKKRGDWVKGLSETPSVKIIGRDENSRTFYFVDSVTSYDDRAQKIAQATARLLQAVNIDFGILGAEERDSGHEVKRFGEEMLFINLKKKYPGDFQYRRRKHRYF